jgi:hypothetical protein
VPHARFVSVGLCDGHSERNYCGGHTLAAPCLLTGLNRITTILLYSVLVRHRAGTYMKIFLRVVIAVLALLAVALVVLRVTGLNPRGPRPGLWLSGNVVAAPVTDWSFADRYPTIEVQTRTWYFVPHSVTIWCVSYQKHLYLQAIGKTWSGNVVRDPRVRVKIGSQLYDGTAAYITDPSEYFGVEANMAQKYSRWHWRASKEYYPDTFFRVRQ